MSRVYIAEPYRSNELGSFGKASYMLLRQFNFPDEYEQRDTLLTADHDRLLMLDRKHTERCFKQHTGTGEMGLEGWVKRASDKDILAFLKDIHKAASNVAWTGYRILGGAQRGNGYNVWTLELFAKHPESATVVYTGPKAPNVLPGPRYGDR